MINHKPRPSAHDLRTQRSVFPEGRQTGDEYPQPSLSVAASSFRRSTADRSSASSGCPPTRSAAVPVVKLVAERQPPGHRSSPRTEPSTGGGDRRQRLAGSPPGVPRCAASPRCRGRPAGRSPLPDSLYELATQVRRRGQVVASGPPGAGRPTSPGRYVNGLPRAAGNETVSKRSSTPCPSTNAPSTASPREVQRLGIATLWDIVCPTPGYDYTGTSSRALVAQARSRRRHLHPQAQMLSASWSASATNQGRRLRPGAGPHPRRMNRGNIPTSSVSCSTGWSTAAGGLHAPYAVDGETRPSRCLRACTSSAR